MVGTNREGFKRERKEKEISKRDNESLDPDGGGKVVVRKSEEAMCRKNKRITADYRIHCAGTQNTHLSHHPSSPGFVPICLPISNLHLEGPRALPTAIITYEPSEGGSLKA